MKLEGSTAQQIKASRKQIKGDTCECKMSTNYPPNSTQDLSNLLGFRDLPGKYLYSSPKQHKAE